MITADDHSLTSGNQDWNQMVNDTKSNFVKIGWRLNDTPDFINEIRLQLKPDSIKTIILVKIYSFLSVIRPFLIKIGPFLIEVVI